MRFERTAGEDVVEGNTSLGTSGTRRGTRTQLEKVTKRDQTLHKHDAMFRRLILFHSWCFVLFCPCTPGVANNTSPIGLNLSSSDVGYVRNFSCISSFRVNTLLVAWMTVTG